MAKIIENEKGFRIIEMTADEAVNKCGFGFTEQGETVLIDDITNELLETHKPLRYIAVLNYLVSVESYEDWYKNAIHYPEDKKYEENHFNYIKNLLNL